MIVHLLQGGCTYKFRHSKSLHLNVPLEIPTMRPSQNREPPDDSNEDRRAMVLAPGSLMELSAIDGCYFCCGENPKESEGPKLLEMSPYDENISYPKLSEPKNREHRNSDSMSEDARKGQNLYDHVTLQTACCLRPARRRNMSSRAKALRRASQASAGFARRCLVPAVAHICIHSFQCLRSELVGVERLYLELPTVLRQEMYPKP